MGHRVNPQQAPARYNAETGQWEFTGDGKPMLDPHDQMNRFPRKLKGAGRGFATGSPNVFKEAEGRMTTVTIHPDEAVVPLPDGRRIPVELTGTENIFRRVEALLEKQITRIGSSPGGGPPVRIGAGERGPPVRIGAGERQPGTRVGAGERGPPQRVGGNIIQNITIRTPDANSFRASQDQIRRDLARDLDYSVRKLGASDKIDDPTRR